MNTIHSLFTHHHRQWWCHRQLFYKFKRYNTILNTLSLFIMALGLIICPVLKNIILIATLSAVGMFVKGWNDFKKYSLKMDMSKFAYSAHAKAITELRSHVQGLTDEEADAFLLKQQMLEEVIIDFAPPLPEQVILKYKRLFQNGEYKMNPLQQFLGKDEADGKKKKKTQEKTPQV